MIKIKPEEPVTKVTLSAKRDTCIYRHYSTDERLLYVGLSVSPIDRHSAHKSTANWFTQIARIELEWFPSYLAAIDAERRAIRDESPQFNKVRYAGATPREYKPTGRPTGRPKLHQTGADKQRAYRERKLNRKES